MNNLQGFGFNGSYEPFRIPIRMENDIFDLSKLGTVSSTVLKDCTGNHLEIQVVSNFRPKV